jgi:hypothetical protein
MTPLLSLATTPVGSSGRPAAVRSFAGDLRDLLGRVVEREDALLGGEVERREALGRVVDDHEFVARLGVRPVEDRRELLVVARREAVELGVLAALDVRLRLGDLVGRDPREGKSFIRSAPVRFSTARA